MAPGVWEQGRWFLWSLTLGFGLGAVYWLLGALRHRFPRTRFWADGAFLLLMGWCLAWLALVVSRGRYGMPHVLGLGLGATVWSVTLGPVFGPWFYRFWDALGRLGGLLLMPMKILAKKTKKISKISFQPGKNGVQ